MEKEFIPYEEALALKELGYDEKYFGKYYYIREHEVYDPRKREDFMFGDNNRIILRDTPHNYGYDPNEITVCFAPLYQQAFRWFREKYNLHPSFPILGVNLYSFVIYSINNKEESCVQNIFDGIVFDKLYKDHVEAELTCLKKLIEITQQRND